MLWASVSTSRKVNRLSLRAALLWTWAIPHFDDEGFQDGDKEILKAVVVPLREDIKITEIPKLRQEIVDQGLWVIYKIRGPAGTEEVYIQDPIHESKQPLRGTKKYQSKIKKLIENQPKVVEGSTKFDLITELNRTELNRTELNRTELNRTELLKKKAQLIDEDFWKEVKLIYTWLDIDFQISKMKGYMLTPKGKHWKMTKRTVIGWLNREDKPLEIKDQPTSIGKTFEAGDLWEKVKEEQDARKRQKRIQIPNGKSKS